MEVLLLDTALRATLIAASTAAVLWALRIRTAAARHSAWALVVIAMLALPVWSMAGIKLPVRVLRAPAPAVSDAAGRLDVPPRIENSESAAVPMARENAPARPFDWQRAWLGLYFFGAGLLLARLIVGTHRANRLRRAAIADEGRATSDLCATPITVGFLKPALILPASWRDWPAGQLNAVLAHEGEHVRRHDPLVQWLALVNRAVFWFHPLSWWLERHLATLAEEACDAAVIAAGHSPQEYSEYLLEMARAITRDGRRIRVVGMAMPGHGLKTRLQQILDEAPAPRVSRTRVSFTLALCALSSGLLAAGSLTSRAVGGSTQSAKSNARAFDVASIKPCTDPPLALVGRRGGLKRIDNSANRLYLDCITLESLADLAYTRNGDFVLNDHIEDAVRGGPDWIKSERFTIEATTTGNPGATTMMGPMLRALLEDRFQLRVHNDTIEVPMYALTVAKDGLKIKPMAAGDCQAEDDSNPPPPSKDAFGPGKKPPCGSMRGAGRGSVRVWDFGGISMSDLADTLDSDRRILDKTGVKGNFVIHLEYERDEKVVDGVNMFAALEQQLGLKLVSIKGPHTIVAIDHVERPTPDEATGSWATSTGSIASRQAPTQGSTFDVASVKPCASPAAIPGGRSGGGGFSNSPGSINVNCQTPADLIRRAYVQYADPPLVNSPGSLDLDSLMAGLPDWAKTERYSIEAKASGTPALTTMAGPMLRALLEDRFRLKIHQSTREVQGFAMVVAQGGLKVKPVDPASCTPIDPNSPGGPRTIGADGLVRAPGSDKPICAGGVGRHGANLTYNATGQTFDRMTRSLGNLLFARPIIDQTGNSDLFTFQLEFAPDETMRPMPGPGSDASDVPTAATLFTVLEKQLGVKLVPAKVAQGFLIIDHLERPMPDGPAAVGARR
jgi:uncharacterized protein (TIGR03435 family)